MKEDKIKYMFKLYRASCEDNKMRAFAMLFGKKLNEPFMIKSSVHKVVIKVRFTENSMDYFDDSCGRWYPTEAFMREFLTGQAVEIDVE